MKKPKKIVVVCGPTAIGKTSTGIELAKKLNGEIISADSRQVYKGMDIGTGKDIPSNSKFQILNSNSFDIGCYEINHIPVWLLDMATPDQQVTVADWIKGAETVLKLLEEKNKLPIIVGGTGFYIQGLIDGIDTLGIPPDKELRKKLNDWPLEKIQIKLKKIAPKVYQKLNRSDKHNPYRLIRKIEIAQADQQEKDQGFQGLDREVLKIGLKAPKKVIYKKIDQRVEQRIEQGLLDEIKTLLDQGYDWDDPGFNTFGYKEFEQFFKDQSPFGDIVRRWKNDEHGYARSQLIWFKRDNEINWFDITSPGWKSEMENLINQCYSENNE